ncbi:ABC transporter ATP-binding protein [Actinotignum schaalii]|uniref:ABC transporter ATP-binding protein n=1 Tax=Actinotignum sp. GS-2025c TaxID=3427276 RepID=UPI003F45E262
MLGPNGAGKTTLLRTLAGQLRPRDGGVYLSGKPLQKISWRELGQSIGYLPQKITFDPRLTVAEFASYIGWVRGVARSNIDTSVRTNLHDFDIDNLTNKKMGSLSGGQLQRAGLAAAKVGDPQILLLDEPTAGLDPVQRVKFRKLLGAHLADTVIISTHLIEDIVHVAETVLVFDQGTIRFSGTVAELESLGSGTGIDTRDMSLAEAGFMAVLAGETPRGSTS